LLSKNFLNCRVLAEIGEPGKKVFPPLYFAPQDQQKPYDLRVQHLSKVFALTFASRPIDSKHDRGGPVALGFPYHEGSRSFQTGLLSNRQQTDCDQLVRITF
jgi:hypothetical protein